MIPSHCHFKMAAFQGEHSIQTANTDYPTREDVSPTEVRMCLKMMYGDCTNGRSSVRCFKDHFILTFG
jgi:hypothetical protein